MLPFRSCRETQMPRECGGISTPFALKILSTSFKNHFRENSTFAISSFTDRKPSKVRFALKSYLIGPKRT
jgi:hypothetical protein